MKTNKVKTVIWDLDNTLWWAMPDTIRYIAKDLKIRYTQELEIQFRYMLKKFDIYFQTHRVTKREMYGLIEKYMPKLGYHGITGEVFLKAWNASKTKILNQEAADLIKKFYKQEKKNIVLSDWVYEKQILLLEDFDLLKYIEKIYTCDDNYLKKNRENISQIIIPGREHEYMFIGDSLVSDIAFANKAGIKSIWYNKDGKPNTSLYTPTFEVDSLGKVPKIVL